MEKVKCMECRNWIYFYPNEDAPTFCKECASERHINGVDEEYQKWLDSHPQKQT